MRIRRRKFLQNSTALMAAGWTDSLLLKYKHKPLMNIPPDFKIRFHATNWGYAGNMESFCAKAKKDGYNGIEVWAPRDPKNQDELVQIATRNQLDLGLLIGASETDPKVHAHSFKDYAKEAVKLNPVYINCHSGRDYFSLEENRPMIDYTYELESQTGIPFYHETHRGRCLYSAPVSGQYLKTFNALKLTLDISHWTNVHESMMEGQEGVLEQAITRTHHIHSRIGHAEGPQINDPRAPEWDVTVNTHLGWWDRVIQARIKEGKKSFTVLTEFGPPPYLPVMPYTQMPLADQWDINLYMMKLLRSRWQ